MHQLVLDCEKMKNANTGLYEFCKQLGNALIRNRAEDEHLNFYVPPQLAGFFGEKEQYIIKKGLHKFWMPHHKADVWHTTFQSSNYIPSGKKIRQVLTIHDLNQLHEKNNKKVKQYFKKIQHNIDRADHIVTISRFVMDDVKQHLRLDNKPVSVVMNGSDMETFPNFNDPGYRPSKPFLFTIGSVNEKKNFHVLPCLLVNNDYELIIAGPVFDENYKTKILAEAQAHGVLNRVKILGSISAQDKYWYYSNSLAFLFPSLAEGFGIPVIEAMSQGKPCFISDKTSLPEVGGKYAYYFHNFDAVVMQQVLTDGLHYYQTNNMGPEIKAHAATFTFDRSAQKYLQIYRSLY